jgi:hypothetical protein
MSWKGRWVRDELAGVDYRGAVSGGPSVPVGRHRWRSVRPVGRVDADPHPQTAVWLVRCSVQWGGLVLR